MSATKSAYENGAIAHGRDALVLCLGRFDDAAPGERASEYFADPYYASTLARDRDFLRAEDYFFRYDADCHWLTRTLPGRSWRPLRRLLGGVLLGSTNLISWSQRLRPILKVRRRPPVVVDLFVPEPRFDDFFAWYEREIDYWPLWIVPCRIPRPYPWLSEERRERFRGGLAIDCAIHGLPNDRPGVDLNEVLERKTYELGGVKTLISKNCYDEATFWTIYHRENYERAKRRLDPHGVFRGLYEKFHAAAP